MNLKCKFLFVIATGMCKWQQYKIIITLKLTCKQK